MTTRRKRDRIAGDSEVTPQVPLEPLTVLLAPAPGPMLDLDTELARLQETGYQQPTPSKAFVDTRPKIKDFNPVQTWIAPYEPQPFTKEERVRSGEVWTARGAIRRHARYAFEAKWYPEKAKYCTRTQIRREVLHALNRTGSGTRKLRYPRKPGKGIKC